MMSLIAAKSDYIYSANEAYANLKEAQNLFEEEAYVLSYVKCALLRQVDLDDFYINGIYVSTYVSSNGYELCFNGNVIDIDVYDKQIVDFSVRR